ncbi:hypothetical protein OXX80_005596 [Metschnikowia pulcherrima]
MSQTPPDSDKQITNEMLEQSREPTPKNVADYLSYKAQETTEDHIAKRQEESRRMSASEEREREQAASGSRNDSGEQSEPFVDSVRSNSAELEPVSELSPDTAQGGRNLTASRKPSSRKPAHTRSQSHTKASTRSQSSASGHKPHLSRSKSTDGIIPKTRPAVRRNGRSNTKLSSLSSLQPLTKTSSNSSVNRALGALQPLTKTMSRESMKSHGLRKTVSNGSSKGVHVLGKTDSSQSIKSVKSSSSIKSLNLRNKSNTSLKGLSSNTGVTGLKTSTKRGKAILSLNEDDTYNEYEDVSEASENDDESRERFQTQAPLEDKETGRDPPPTTGDEIAASMRNLPEERFDLPPSAPREHSAQSVSTQNSPPFVNNDSRTTSTQSAQSNQTYNNDEPNTNLYGGSFLLSQSTGMTRKIEPSTEMLGFVPSNSNSIAGQLASEQASGIVFNPQAEDDLRTEAEPAVTKTTVTQGSYQPNQTIFSNLQRNDSKYLSNVKSKRQSGVASATSADAEMKKDFAGYLNSQSGNGHNIETRTQQRLWLQRENSLLDVSANMDMNRVGNFSNMSLNKLMFAHNYNNSGSTARETPGSVPNWGQNPEAGSAGREAHTPALSESPVSAANILHFIQNGQQNSIQSRTEFERLNREYVNVRRHLNPVAESLNRVEKLGYGKKDLEIQKKSDKKATYAATSNANSFKEFAPTWEKNEGESVLMLNRLWSEALLSCSSSTLSTRLLQQESQHSYHSQNQRLGEYANQNSSQDLTGTNQMKQHRRNLGNSVPRSPAPTTRAVKLASAHTAPDQSSRQR